MDIRATKWKVRLGLAAAAVCAVWALGSTADDAHAASEIRLVIGEQRVLNVQALARLAVGDPRIADVQVLGDGRQILITAKQAGRTNLIIWNVEGRKDTIPVTVLARDPDVIASQIRDLIGDVEGVNVRVVGDRVVLDGRVFTQGDIARIERVSQLFTNVANFVEIDATAQRLVIEEINRSMRANGIMGIRARDVGGAVFLEGDATSEDEASRAVTIAGAFNPAVTNLVRVGTALTPLILMEAQFLSLNRTKAKNVGFDWDDSLQLSVDYSFDGEFANFLGDFLIDENEIEVETEEDFEVVVNFLLSTGFGRDLAHPKLIVRSGEAARFVSGSSIPLVSSTLTTTSVTFRDVGVILDVLPTLARDDTINSFVDVEVSSIDASQTFGGLPVIQVQESSSMISVKDGQTVAVSGSFRNLEGKGLQKVPFVGQVPVFGEAFRSRSSTKDIEEVVIFVTPKVITPESEENFEMVEGIQRKYQEVGERLEWSIFD